MSKHKKIDCFKCKFFYVTWDKHFPYGCKVMGFKSKEIPSNVVLKSSKMSCLFFKNKGK
ncbi:MAG TPA: uracil-DNA glycosylase [Candidatus Desulfofervidus auxilii]|uniref:Uracil-DNA glycosylase n=1 Tax=Desulfofervidus auxilii TaxID=1621989 RepID=A0A7C1W4U6_DESA2|nr:uracil-DNA glycosylase [Candidatus Desulfofervidus auxilii]HEC68580.1 uracil-DNA glycosylase [Candidatus Desulfofervidus auxilii]